MEMSIPNEWAARGYQKPLIKHMLYGGLDKKRGIGVWHRRAGKDSVCLNLAAIASQMRVGTIWHMLPTQTQARKVIWKGIDKQGRRMIDQAFPPEMRKKKNESEMSIEMHNGSIYQLVGSDNFDSLVGSNPVGIIFSEYSIANPLAWDFLRPILSENDGWAMFIYTTRGNNHGKQLFDNAKKNERWFAEVLTVEDTTRDDGTPVITQEAVQEERDMGMSEEKIQQEFYCSWEGGMEGAFYTKEMAELNKSDRLGMYPHNPKKQVITYWDIGIRDQTSIIFAQRGDDGQPVIIDHMVGRNVSVEEWIKEVRDKPYNYENHYFPHDGKQRDKFKAKPLSEQAWEIGFSVEVIPNDLSREAGINLVRSILKTARFNEGATERLRDGLQAYRKEYDDRLQRFKDTPLHDWASDIADSMRYLAMAWQPEQTTHRGNAYLSSIKTKKAFG